MLPVAWRLGAGLARGVSYGVDSWDELLEAAEYHRRQVGQIREAQVWGHGYSRGPVISGVTLKPNMTEALAEALGPDLELFLLRMCQAANNQALMEALVDALQCPVGAHTQVTNPPDPRRRGQVGLPVLSLLQQRGFVILEPGERARWPDGFEHEDAVIGTLALHFDRRTRKGARRYRKGRVWTRA